jgi:hypothetical protein
MQYFSMSSLNCIINYGCRCIVEETHLYFLPAISCIYLFLCGQNWIIAVIMIRPICYADLYKVLFSQLCELNLHMFRRRFVYVYWACIVFYECSLSFTYLLDTCTLFTINLKKVFDQHAQQTFYQN